MNKPNHLLVIFFNIDFSSNIPKLNQLYQDRFSNILYVAPDHYTGLGKYYFQPYYKLVDRSGLYKYAQVNMLDKLISKYRRILNKQNQFELSDTIENLQRVVGHKFYFQDYFWQIRESLNQNLYDWFWFVSDDVLLHPRINQNNILSEFGVSKQSKSVITKPYFARDYWLKYFMGNIDDVDNVLSKNGTNFVPENIRDFSPSPDHKGPCNRYLLGGCSDMFAIHKSILTASLNKFHSLAMSNIFVEIAIHNTLLSLDKDVTVFDQYTWEFDSGRGDLSRVKEFIGDESKLFFHPVKLSLFDKKKIQILKGAK